MTVLGAGGVAEVEPCTVVLPVTEEKIWHLPVAVTAALPEYDPVFGTCRGAFFQKEQEKALALMTSNEK